MKSIQASDKLEEVGSTRAFVKEIIKAEDCQAKIKGLEELDKEIISQASKPMG